MTCANCGRDLLDPSSETYALRCGWCALAPARGIWLAFAISSLIWWLLWRFGAWILS